MNVASPEAMEPVRVRFETPMTDEELLRFCAQNELARIALRVRGR